MTREQRTKKKKPHFPRGPFRSSWDQVHESAEAYDRYKDKQDWKKYLEETEDDPTDFSTDNQLEETNQENQEENSNEELDKKESP